MIYLDNAATSHHKPKSVRKIVNKCFNKYSANPGRSAHRLSIETLYQVYKTRSLFAKTFNTSIQDVIFLSNCSEALNFAINGVNPTGNVITSLMEHNSVLRVLSNLEKQGKINITYLTPNDNGIITASMVENAILPTTSLICITHMSNVTGAINPIFNIGKVCKKHNIKFIVDSAQGGGIEFLDMKACNISCLAFAGHKNLYGIQGGGVLLLNNVILTPLLFGGNGVDSFDLDFSYKPPECYEVGTIPTPCILSLLEGLKFAKKHIARNNLKLRKLTIYAITELSKIPNIIIYSNIKNCMDVITFNINNISSGEVVNFLSSHNIMTRGGLHCAPLIHKHLKTGKSGAVRISLSVFNTKRELKKTIKLIKKFATKKLSS